MRWLLACVGAILVLTACSSREGEELSITNLNSPVNDLNESSPKQDGVLPMITPTPEQSAERVDTNETSAELSQVVEITIDVWNIEEVGKWPMGASFSSLKDKIEKGAFEGKINKYGEVVFTNTYFDLSFREGTLSSVYVEQTGLGIGNSLVVGDSVSKADSILGKPDAKMDLNEIWYFYGDITGEGPLALKIDDGKIVAISYMKYSEGNQEEHQTAINYLNELEGPRNSEDQLTVSKLTKNQLKEIFETARSDMKKFADIHKMDNSEEKKEQIIEILDAAYEIQIKLEEAQQGDIETEDKFLTDALLQYTNTIYDDAYLFEFLLLSANDKYEIASYKEKISESMYAAIKQQNEINTYLLVKK